MIEKYKITGKGELHNKDYGKLPMDKNEIIDASNKISHEPIKSVIYDSKLDQFCVDNQWEIPFHRGLKNKELRIMNDFKKMSFDIIDIKKYFITKQYFELASYSREIEKLLLKSIKELKKKG